MAGLVGAAAAVCAAVGSQLGDSRRQPPSSSAEKTASAAAAAAEKRAQAFAERGIGDTAKAERMQAQSRSTEKGGEELFGLSLIHI